MKANLKLVDCLLCRWQDLPADSDTTLAQVWGVSCRCLRWLRAQVEIFSPDQISGLGVLPGSVPSSTCAHPDLPPLTL